MLSVKVRPNESPERAISKLKNLVVKEGVLNAVKDKRYYSHASRGNSRERLHRGRESRTTIRRSRQHRESGRVSCSSGNKRLDTSGSQWYTIFVE